MAGFLTAAMAAAGSSSIGGALVRLLVAYGVSRLINKATGSTNTPEAVDQGIRLQVGPDTTNTIPVLYGSAYLGGKITDAQIADANKTMWYCLTLAENPGSNTRLSDNATITTTVDEVYWNNQRVYFKADGVTVDYIVNQDGVVDTSPRDLVKIYLYNSSGTPIRPSDLLEYLPSLPTLHGDARTLMPGWVSDERMLSLTFALVKISYNRDKGITGLPDLQFKVSNNLFRPGDAIYSYLRNGISGAGMSANQIDTASLIALNGYADDTVSYYDEDDNQTKTLANRYQINGVINSAATVMTNLQKLAGNCGCFVNYDIATGLWGVTLNKDETPVLAFNDSNIISGIDLTGTNLDSMYNAVEVQFPHRELRDQLDTIRIDLPDEYRNSNEPDNVLQLKLDLINEPLQARELGYLELYQNRMDQVVTFTTDYSKINTEAGDVVTVSTDVYNWTNKPFRVVRVREIESEEGGLAVEITAQEYDSTMYTAGGLPRRPRVPSEAIAIPDIAVIGTPAAPTVAELNNVAVPALDITGVTPSGIVDRFEYWYSSDAGTTYKVLGSRSNSNGSPYTQGTSLTFRAASLPAGTYLFKVRGGNERAFGDFSATTSKTWAPVQVTDQVTAETTVGGGLSDLIGPLAMGAIAYFAYQALYPEVMKALGDSAVGSALGIPSSAIQEMKNAAGNFKLVQVGDSIQTPYNNDTITFVAGAGIEITAVANDGIITIAATGGGSGGAVSKIIAGTGVTVTPTEGTGEVTISVSGSSGSGAIDNGGATTGTTTLNGSVFPCQYINNSATTTGVFTHNHLAFATSSLGGIITNNNVVAPSTVLTPSISATATRYYTTCTYDSSKNLQSQSWAAWTKWIPPTTRVETYVTGTANSGSLTYSVDGEYNSGGTSLKTPTVAVKSYDYFIPDSPTTSSRTITTANSLVKAEPGQIVLFGGCMNDLGTTVPFNSKTIFGIATTDYVASNLTPVIEYAGGEIVYGAGKYVTASPTVVDTIFYSTNGINWTKVSQVTFNGSENDITRTGIFKLAPYNPVSGKFLAWRNFVNNSNGKGHGLSTSTDGINWVETENYVGPEPSTTNSNPGGVVNKININPAGHYIANVYVVTPGQTIPVVPLAWDSYYSIDDGVNWVKMPFQVSDSCAWDATNSRWFDGDSYFSSVTSTAKTALSFATGVVNFLANMASLLSSQTRPANVPSNYTLTGVTGSTVQWLNANGKIYGMYSGGSIRWRYMIYDSLGALIQPPPGPNTGPSSGIIDTPLSGSIIGIYIVNGNTVTNAYYLLDDATNNSLVYYDSINNIAIAKSNSAGWLQQIYLSGTTVTRKYLGPNPNGGAGLVAGDWLANVNGSMQLSRSSTLYKFTRTSGSGSFPVTGTYDALAADTIYPGRVAYATNYVYPGVSGTTTLNRVGTYGINTGATSSVGYNVTYSSAT